MTRLARLTLDLIAATLLVVLPFTAAQAADTAGAGEFRALLVAVRKPVIAAEIAGKISSVGFRPGEAFRQGDVLLSFDCTLNEAREKRAKAVRDRAESQLNSLQALEKRGATSKLEVALARADVAGATADLGAAHIMVERCEIRAPFAGRVVDQRIQAGEYAAESQPLLEIIDDSELELETIVPSSLVPVLRVGGKAEAIFDEVEGRVPFVWSRIAPQIDPVSRTIKLYGRLAEPRAGLLAGMSGSVSIDAGPAR